MANKKKSPKTKASSKPESANVKKEKKTVVKNEQKMPVKKEQKATAKKTQKPAVKKEQSGAAKFFGKIKQFFKDVKGETKKIVWNSREDTFKNTGVVFMVTGIVGSGVWICDFAFRKLIEFIFSLA
ncbi:MAG: preprotein translocase subunit SecE [Ruminococcaceae bacterium]|nr:preprotein translocase subunit SecE [Oscillospiraceae bacterium]